MEKIDFTIFISREDFPKYFKEIFSVQNTMNKLRNSQATFLKEMYDFLEDEPRDQENYEKDKEELARLEDSIPLIRYNLENATNASNKKKYQTQLNAAENSRERLINRLNSRDESDLVFNKMKFHNNQLFAHGIDDWVHSLGEWFEEGHLGPGTVTYKDKTYTAV